MGAVQDLKDGNKRFADTGYTISEVQEGLSYFARLSGITAFSDEQEKILMTDNSFWEWLAWQRFSYALVTLKEEIMKNLISIFKPILDWMTKRLP